MVCSVSIPLLADLIGGLKQFIVDALEMVCFLLPLPFLWKKMKKIKKMFHF